MARNGERPLKGRVILATRPAERGEELGRLLRDRGARLEQRPTIALVPPSDPRPAREALSGLDRFDWLIFTSSNGVRFFFDRLASVEPALPAPRGRAASIGPATSRELEARGFPATVVASESRAEGLADALRERVRPGERALLVCPEESRPLLAERLQAQGLSVEAVPFYRNVAAPEVGAIALDVISGRYDAVVFTAPSTLRRLLEGAAERPAELRAALARIALVAIGPVTAGALEEQSFEAAAVAPEPSDRGIAEALRQAFPD